jgi:hypothetical protein
MEKKDYLTPISFRGFETVLSCIHKHKMYEKD